MDIKSYRQKAAGFLREYLNIKEYIDVEAAMQNIRSNVPFRGPTVYILFIAVIIASVGLNVNSIPVIIGAMLISPLMGPIIGFGLGLGTNDRRLLLSSLRNLGIMFVVSLLAATLYFVVTPLEIDNPTELLARTNPSIYDVMIAFFGGLAGVLEISRKDKGTVMSGVAIATALMPPLCTVGYGIANLNWHYAGGALYLFFINCVFIALATFLTARALRFPQAEEKGYSRQRVFTYTLLILIVLVPSVFSGYTIVKQNVFARNARHFVMDNKSVGKTYIFDYTTDLNAKPYTLSLRLAGETLSNESKKQLLLKAGEYGIAPAQVIFLEDATIHFETLNDKEIMKDWMASNEKLLSLRDDSIRTLNERLEYYESQVLPSKQLADEICSQYPDIKDVTIARGAEVAAGEVQAEDQVVVIIKSESELTDSDKERLVSWLKIRLNTDLIQLVSL